MWLQFGQLIAFVIELVFTILLNWEEGGKGEKKKEKTDTDI
ncbi:hypothetical protein Q9R38_26070 [Priestia aryabhattai]|nr:hypothetical protein [Priestia aryabhattai]MDT0150011.1 hypothetical protein [Priestia aryabhattai]MDT0155581.1 hypothetical protein [Priestia aryabhattai]